MPHPKVIPLLSLVLAVSLVGCPQPSALPGDPAPEGDDPVDLGWDLQGEPYRKATPASFNDFDGDGILAVSDCDDWDPNLGVVLYESSLSEEDPWFSTTPQLDDPWRWEDGSAFSPAGGQQALLGEARAWTDIAVFAVISSDGTEEGCGADCDDACADPDCASDRWRGGVLLRASVDADQDEGYHGYRCALARNAPDDCYPEGHFLQIGEFMDAPEDDVDSECVEGAGCPNPTFDQLARTDHPGSLDLSAGDRVTMEFYAVGSDLWCSVGNGPSVPSIRATATDTSFASGTIGFSTLDLLGEFDHVKVCEAFATP